MVVLGLHRLKTGQCRLKFSTKADWVTQQQVILAVNGSADVALTFLAM